MQDFRQLRVWQAAHRATIATYEVTATFPQCELFGLTAQLRRSVSSVAANIAEGCGRGSTADTRRFLQIALGSATESLNHLLLARDLGLLGTAQFEALERDYTIIRRMLIRLIARLK